MIAYFQWMKVSDFFKKDSFCGRGSGYLLYLHDVLRFLEMTM